MPPNGSLEMVGPGADVGPPPPPPPQTVAAQLGGTDKVPNEVASP
jgi:hypothetical protein